MFKQACCFPLFFGYMSVSTPEWKGPLSGVSFPTRGLFGCWAFRAGVCVCVSVLCYKQYKPCLAVRIFCDFKIGGVRRSF